MSQRTLGTLYSHFIAKTENVNDTFNTSLPSSPVHKESCIKLSFDGRERQIIKLQLYWGEFCHELLVKSAIGGYKTLKSGTLNPARISKVTDIYTVANKISRGRDFPWHIPYYCTNLAKTIGTQNYGQILMGLSITAPIDDLRDVRNHLVHPCKTTQLAFNRVASKYGYPSSDPISLLATIQKNGKTLLFKWIESLRLMAEISIR